MLGTTRTLTTNKRHVNKLVLGFVGIAATTVIGTAGLAAARPDRNPGAPNPPSKAACDNFAQFGFKNKGQCVSWWETHNNPGHGYGGHEDGDDQGQDDHGHGQDGGNRNTVNTNVAVDLRGDHNFVSVVLHYIFG